MVSTEAGMGTSFSRYDMGVSAFWTTASMPQQQAQRDWQETLRARADMTFGADAFVSQLAVVFPDRLVLGDRTYVSAHSYLWGDVEVGDDCTLNPFTEVRGRITIGNGVRIGAHTSILGFNHSMSIERPIFEQPLEFKGIAIGDDVWIGSHAVIVDGVTIGDHSIIGAGSVVTKDVAPWSVVAGNPARKLSDRRGKRASNGMRELERLSDVACGEMPMILANAWDRGDGKSFVDRTGAAPTVRAWCDAVELAGLFDNMSILPVPPQVIIDQLRSRQDAVTGLIPEWGDTDARPTSNGHDAVNYHVLCAGYALRQLGSSFAVPIRAVDDLTSVELRAVLDAQPWKIEGWRAGARVDSIGTGMLWNRNDFSRQTEIETLFGWLVTRCDPATGMWGAISATSGWLEPVNGFYRLTRGTFAQFGVPLPYPQQTINTVLEHAGNGDYFGPDRGTACNVLDIIHPLWLAAKQSSHRRAEGEAWARRQLDRLLSSWNPGEGFSFALERGQGWQRAPGLLGSEMWLSIAWLLADYLGASDLLGFRPRGIHRPEQATSLTGFAW